jgi:hypothetical protein
MVQVRGLFNINREIEIENGGGVMREVPSARDLVMNACMITTKKIIFCHLQFATCTVTVHVANC